MPVITDGCGKGGDDPGFRGEGIEIIVEPARPEHHEGKQQAYDRHQAEDRRGERIEVGGQHG